MTSRRILVPCLQIIGLLLSIGCLAQNIRGTVKDSTGKAIAYASINLRNAVNNSIIGYTFTDVDGAFRLPIPADTLLRGVVIEASCIGYKSLSRPITDEHLACDFTLSISANQLQSVEIKSNRPVLRVHGDTLGYKVSDFASAQDMVIGDVLKRLPGITIGSDGAINYNGKPISNLYINGDNLLDDKYNIATRTIPQGVVEQVQVIQNDQPVKVLQNKVMSNDVALNLTIKKDAQIQMLGQESLAVGLPGKYNADLNAMMFKDNYKAINYLKGNNTGSDLQQELVGHHSTNSEQSGDNEMPGTLLSLGTANNPPLSRDRYLFNQSGLLNLNNLVKLRDDIQLRINAWYFHDKQRQDFSQQSALLLSGDTIRYNETRQNRSRYDLLHSQFTLTINRDKYYLHDALVLGGSWSAHHSSLRTDEAAVNQVFHDNHSGFSNEFNLIRSLRSNNIIQIYSYVSHSAEPGNMAIGPNYEPAIFNKGYEYAQVIQTVNVPTWYTNNYVSFKIPSNLITQSFKAGYSVQSQILTSSLDLLQVDNRLTPQSDSSMNHLNWTRTKIYAEAGVDLLTTALQANLNLPVSLQQINYSDDLYALDRHMKRVNFNPLLKIKYQVSAENHLYLSYNYRRGTGGIEDIYQGYILKNYLALYANNADLIEKKDQHVSAGFSFRKSLIMLFANLNIDYHHLNSSKIASETVTNTQQRAIVLPYANATGSWMASGSMSKYSFALRTTFSGGLRWQRTRSMQLQNDQFLPFKTITKAAYLGADTKAGKHVTIAYRANLVQTASHSPAIASMNHINQVQQQVVLEYNPLINVHFKLSGEHYFTRQEGNSDLKYFFADASAKVMASKWKTTFELSAANFLDVKTYRAVYLSANMFRAGSNVLPGRIVLLKAVFNIW